MKKIRLLLIGFIGFLFLFVAPLAYSGEAEKIEKLVSYTLEKGTLQREASYRSLQKVNKVSEAMERRLYFTVCFVVWNGLTAVTHIDCMEEIWTKTLKDGKPVIVIKQKMSRDGGGYINDVLIQDATNGILLEYQNHVASDEVFISWYEGFIEEMFKEIDLTN